MTNNKIEITGVKKLIEVLRAGVKKYPDFRVILNKSKIWYGNQYCPACGCFSSLVDAGKGKRNGSHWSDTGTWISSILGFENQQSLMYWAHTHPEIWGNESGRMLFRHVSAYGILGNLETTGVKVLNHWEKVLERLQKSS